MAHCTWPRFHTSVALSLIYIESSIKVRFSEAVIDTSVIPYLVIALDILFKHALWPDTLDLDSHLSDFVMIWRRV